MQPIPIWGVKMNQIKLKGRRLVYVKSDNRFHISIPPAIGHALLEDGVRKVDVIIIIPDKNEQGGQEE